MPRVQRLQGRLPGQRGHGDLQGRVLSHYYAGRLRPRARLRVRADLLVGAARVARARLANFRHPGAAACATRQGCSAASRRNGEIPTFAAETFQAMVRSGASQAQLTGNRR